jgi:hypothetical protein
MRLLCRIGMCTLLIVVMFSSGCGFFAPVPESIYETTSAEMAITLPGMVSPMGLSTGSAADVIRMTVDVAGEDIYGVHQDPLATGELTLEGDGVWRVTLVDLPIGPALTFTVRGYDAADDEIFSGVTVQSLSGLGDTVSVDLEPVADVGMISFPIITQITRAGEIVNGSTDNPVSVDVHGSADEQLSYAFTSGGGSFLPESGTVDLPSSGVGTVVSGYDASAAIGEYYHSVRVTNSQGNSVTTSFPTLVVYGTGSMGMEISFAPSVIGLSAERIGNVVRWEAQVTDDGPQTELVYLWEYDGGLSFVYPASNPADLSGYDETTTGTITLTVTDGSGAGLSTTVSFLLAVGQFPDTQVAPVIPAGLQIMIGGSSGDGAASIGQTTDGGYIVAGFSASTDIPGTTNHGGSDYYVVKLDAIGVVIWQTMIGGSGTDWASSVQQTTDGGYIVAGDSRSTDIAGVPNHAGGLGEIGYGSADAYIVKLDAMGGVNWQIMVGGHATDSAASIQQTTDGGYIFAGSSESFGNETDVDCYIVKLDDGGVVTWEVLVGGHEAFEPEPGMDFAQSIQQTTDGGYIVAGYSNSTDIPGAPNHFGSEFDYYVIKLDAAGAVSWQTVIGGRFGNYFGLGLDRAYSIQQTTDGGYIVAGSSS